MFSKFLELVLCSSVAYILIVWF